MSPPIRHLLTPGLVLLALSAWSADAAEPASPATGGSDRTPASEILRLPDLKLEAPRRVQAATAALGLGRQRLALVLGQSRVAGVDLPAATRDARAVAEVLRKSGFVVMHRDDLNAAELRSTLKEFRGRLDPGAAGLIYVAGAGGRLDGQSMVLTRDLSAAAAATADGLRAASVPLQEVVEALQITPSSLRLIVVDAAPGLAALPPERRGLAAPRLPEGVMALMSAPPGQTLEPRLPPPLPNPLPSDPRELTGSAFGTAVAHALTGARVTGPDALRNARRLAIDGTGGAVTPWLAGATDEKDEFAAPDLVETLLPQTPEEAAARAVRKVSGLAGDALRAGGSAAVRAAVPPGVPAPVPGGVPGVGSAVGSGSVPAGSPPVPGAPGAGVPTASAVAPSPTTGTADASGRSSQPGTPDIGQVAQSVAQQAATVASVAATGAAVVGAVEAAKAEAVSTAVSTAVATALPVVTQALGTVASALGVGNATPSRVDTSLKDARERADDPPQRPAGSGSGSSGSGTGNASGSSAPTSSTGTATTATTAPTATTPPPASPVAEGPAGSPSSPTARATDPAASTPPDATPAGSPPPGEPAPTAAEPTPAAPAAPSLPVMNPYGYAAGDTFTYRRFDEWKGEEIGRLVQVIRQVMSDGEMEAQQNGATQALDAQGRTRSRSGPEGRAEFTPVEEFWWSRPKPGESRDVEFTERFQRGDGRGERRWEGEVEVGKPTRIDTPAGSFDVLPMEGEGWYHEILQPGNVRRSVMWERTVWYSPDLGHPVAIDILERDAGSRLLRKERVELTNALTSRTLPK